MNGYIKKQSLMDFCENTASKTIDNNDIARFPTTPVVEIDHVLEIIDEATADVEELKTEIDVGREKAVISFEKKDGMLAMASLIKVLVLALKGGEQE